MLEVHFTEDSLLKFKQVLESVDDDLFVEADFNFSPTSFSFQAMNNNAEALVELHLKVDWLQYYRCDTAITMAMNLNFMAKVFKEVEKDDTVIMKSDDNSSTVTFTKKPINMIFQTKRMDIDHEHAGTIPELKSHDAVVTMPSAKFAKICEDLNRFGDTVAVISVNNTVGMKFYTKGDVRFTMFCRQNTIADKPEDSTTITVAQAISIGVALNYLNPFTKANPLADTVTISLTLERPVVVEYKIDDIGHIRFYLAPLIEEDGEWLLV